MLTADAASSGSRPFLTAEWRYLAMLNYEVPAARRGRRMAGRWHRLEATTRGRPALPDPASEAAFTAEHYWGYTVQRDGGAKEYRVDYPPWRVWEAEGAALDCDVAAVYGAGFAECLGSTPRSAFLAEGSAVTVSRGRRLPTG